MTLPIDFRDSPAGASFSVRIHPHSSKTAITGTLGGALKVSVSAPPVDGRANEALIEYFSNLFNVPLAAVQILGGRSGRSKLIRIDKRSADELAAALELYFAV
jgi:hypothetical protein